MAVELRFRQLPGARRTGDSRRPGLDRSGQSLVEFLVLMPLLIGLTVIMVRVTTAIQVSIVNQQYARAQSLFLAYNSAVYPRLQQREDNFIRRGYNNMVIGVSDNSAPDSGPYVPKATVQKIARKPNGGGSDENQSEPERRDKVRVRTTVTLCTQTNVLQPGKDSPILPLGPDYRPTGRNRLAENVKLDFCGGPVPYEQ
jgi:hypothetical protein